MCKSAGMRRILVILLNAEPARYCCAFPKRSQPIIIAGLIFFKKLWPSFIDEIFANEKR